jgi:hypothetical protein
MWALVMKLGATLASLSSCSTKVPQHTIIISSIENYAKVFSISSSTRITEVTDVINTKSTGQYWNLKPLVSAVTDSVDDSFFFLSDDYNASINDSKSEMVIKQSRNTVQELNHAITDIAGEESYGSAARKLTYFQTMVAGAMSRTVSQTIVHPGV